jgi:hypothetical protein
LNQVFKETFDKSSIDTAMAIQLALRALSPYLDTGKVNKLLACFGVTGNKEDLCSSLTKLSREAHYILEKLGAILAFNGSSVSRDEISNLELELDGFKIDFNYLDTYFVSNTFKSEISELNNEIDELLNKIETLKNEIGIYSAYLRKRVADREEDINDFLDIAGINYKFRVQVEDEGRARALIEFVSPDNDKGDVVAKKHLSWGEKNALALILFMFDAISKEADLIILDDPVSSFDNNKKFAIINRLFITGDRENSLYQRTVLMLTHDLQPVIDYVQVSPGRQSPDSICAAFLENNNGYLTCQPICRNIDLMSTTVLLKEMALDGEIDIVARCCCLRRYIEHQFMCPKEESEAYNLLSDLLHGREIPFCDDRKQKGMTEEQKRKKTSAESYIKEYMPLFSYEDALPQLNQRELLKRYLSESNQYIKLCLLRAYITQNEDASERLRRDNYALLKFLNETHHIENDYLYSLDVRRFNIVPGYYIEAADKFVNEEKCAAV